MRAEDVMADEGRGPGRRPAWPLELTGMAWLDGGIYTGICGWSGDPAMTPERPPSPEREAELAYMRAAIERLAGL